MNTCPKALVCVTSDYSNAFVVNVCWRISGFRREVYKNCSLLGYYSGKR